MVRMRIYYNDSVLRQVTVGSHSSPFYWADMTNENYCFHHCIRHIRQQPLNDFHDTRTTGISLDNQLSRNKSKLYIEGHNFN